MATFPKLQTGAVLQYPATRKLSFGSRVMRFVDGSEQRFRSSRRALRKWEIRLALLSDSELTELEHFFSENQGAFGSFSFTDPADNAEYPNCTLESERIALRLFAEGRGSTSLIIRENLT